MNLRNQISDVVDLVVAGGIELVKVERLSVLDGHTTLTDAAGLPVLHVLAVEGLGQDAGGGRLAGAPGSAEQIGMAVAPLRDCGLQRRRDVSLAAQL